jgi:WD40 repeat protein
LVINLILNHFYDGVYNFFFFSFLQVWDVSSASVIACYDGHHNTVLCCLPSPLHPDIVITGSSDCTLRVWNINKYKGVTKPKSSEFLYYY